MTRTRTQAHHFWRQGVVRRASSALLFVVLASVMIIACQSDKKDDMNLNCGAGEHVAAGDAEVCIYEKGLIIETGFECPPAMNFDFELDGFLVCSPTDTLSDGILVAISDEIGAEPGTLICAPSCGSDEMCDPMLGVCVDSVSCAPIDGVCPAGCSEDECPTDSDPCITITPEVIDFGVVSLETTRSTAFTISNCGSTSIVVDDFTFSGADVFGVLEGPDLSSSISPGEGEQGTINFSPTQAGEYEGIITATLDDGTVASATVQGIGAECATAVAGARVVGSADYLTQLELQPLGRIEFTSVGSMTAGAGSIESYEWRVVQAPEGFVESFWPLNDAENPEIELTLVGTYAFELDVTDSNGISSCEPARIEVTTRPVGQLHIELIWDTPADLDQNNTGFGQGSDLDLHLIHGGGNWDNRSDGTDCHFRNCGQGRLDWGVLEVSDDNPSLDRDDVDGAGPEVILLPQPAYTDGSQAEGYGEAYEVGVYFYDGSEAYGAAHATLNIYIDGLLSATWTKTLSASDNGVELNEGDFWWAGSIDWDASGATLTERGTLTTGFP